MYGNAFKDAIFDRIALQIQKRLKMRKDVETVINEVLEKLSSNLPDDVMNLFMNTDGENDSIQAFPNNPGPSTVKIQSEIRQSADQVSEQPETPNSFMKCASAEIIDNAGPSTMEIQPEICHSADKVSEQSEIPNFVMECTNAEIIDNPGPSTMEIQSEMCHSADKVSEQPEIPNFFMDCTSAEIIDNPGSSTMEIQSQICHIPDKVSRQLELLKSKEYASAEIIDVPSDSDIDSDSSDDSYDDISIIGTVKTVNNDSAPSCSSLHLDNKLLPNKVEIVATNNDREAAIVNNMIQDGPKEVIKKNNKDVVYMRSISKKKRLSKSPKPECSKDFDDTSPKLEVLDSYNFSNLDELLKDAKLIHALLPRFSHRLIYRKLYNNQFARNRIELTLWDLLPIERPLPQPLQKRKCLDNEICFVEHKKNSNTSLQKDQLDVKTVLKKKEQVCVKNEVIVDNRKSENRIFAFMDETDEMKKNISEMTTSNNMNNDINEQNAIPMKKTKLIDKLDEAIKYIEDNTIIAKAKVYASPEVNRKDKEWQSIRNLEVKKKNDLFSDNKFSLQPAKLTLQNNFVSSLQKDERLYKPTTSLLSPPKLKIIDKSTIQIPTIASVPSLSTASDIPNVIQMKQNELVYSSDSDPNSSILSTSTMYPTSTFAMHPTSKSTMYPNTINVMKQNESIVRISNQNPSSSTLNTSLSTPSNDKKASDIHIRSQSNSKIWRIVPSMIQRAETNLSKVEEMEGTKLTNVHSTRIQAVTPVTLYNPLSVMPSSSVTVQNLSDHSKANNSGANYNFEQEYEEFRGNMSAAQVCEDEKQQDSPINVQRALQRTIQLENLTNSAKKFKINTIKEQAKHITNANFKDIILNEKATKIYNKLIPIFPCIKTYYIKQLCHDYVKDDGQSQDEAVLLENLVEMLLNCDQENPSVKQIKPLPEPTDSNPPYDMNEQYADLLMIFPEADPVYLRKIAEEIYSDPERIKEFVQSKLENPDYPTRAQYLAKKKITKQQKQYTTDFQVEQFLEIFPDPFSYFEDHKRKCQFNPHAVDFLKYYFSKLRVNTLVKAYSQYMHNLSLTAKALEALNPDMKTRRYCNKTTLTEDIPFLQECAFIQHKAELKKYLDEVKAKEEQEFNELKVKNELLECQCCFDNECMPSKCSTCEDGHIFCNSCIIRSVDVILGDGNTRVDCLLQCGCEFPISVLQRVLPPTKFSILLCKRQEAEIIAAGVEGLVSCPFCHFASIPPPEDKIFKCLNPECMKESCRFCKELNHIPLKCNEKKAESARLYLEEKMTEALVRKCYRCSRMFFKEEGCNKMTCVCGAQMCYICDKPVTDYKHFQGQGAERSNLCPLWSDDRRMNAESVIRVCNETMKQIKEKDPKIDINVDVLLPKLPPKSKGPHEDIQNAMVLDRIARHLQ